MDRRHVTLADERGPFVYEVDGLDVDVRALLKALEKVAGLGKPAAFGPCGISIRLYSSSRVCNGSILVTQADHDGDEWIHASIARETWMPTYSDLTALKAGVFGPGRYAFQVFPPVSRHVNIHARALHLWGRADGTNPLPDFGAAGTI